MAHDVFISYSNQDKAVADALCATLEANKIRCWIAPRDVPPGQPWPAAIIRAIGEAKVFVLVFSGNANKSPQVYREVEQAVSKEIPILPFRIEDVPPSDEMQYYIGSIHWLDALTPPIENHMRRLVDTVLKLMEVVVEPAPQPLDSEPGTQAKPATGGGTTPRPSPTHRPGWRHLVFILGVVIVAVAALALGLNRWGSWLAELKPDAPRESLPETSAVLTDLLEPTRTPEMVRMTETAELSTPTQSVEELPGDAPPVNPEAGIPGTALPYLLPLPEPVDVVFNEALKVLYDDQLVTLEMVAGEQRFRSRQNEAGFSNSNSLAWDERRNVYWSVRGASYWVGYEIDQLDAQGNVLATYTVPEMIGYPRYITVAEGFLWVTSDKGGIHKLEVVEGSSELKVVDSFALSLGKFPSSVVDGIDWDGESLWVLSDDVVTRLGLSMQAACSILLPSDYPQPSWYGYRGLAWDGEYLWAGHAEQNMLYRIDPVECQ
jgi:hypothetical protein